MSEDPDQHSMTLWEHLEELRSRLVKMIIAFVAGAIGSWFYRRELLDILTRPFVTAWHRESAGTPSLHFQAPAAAFTAFVKLAGLGGLVVALPIILYQVWAFVAPGLYSKEKRLALPFVFTSCLLFAGGAYFGWAQAFPRAFDFLLGMGGKVGGDLQVQPTVMINDYIEFVTYMLLAFGAAAELPVFVFFLSIAGLVTHHQLIKFFRYWVVIAFVIAAVITPPDPLSQLLLAVPLILLYALSILVAWVFARKRSAAAT